MKNKDQIELKVKWEDYTEPTWEAFNGFVKDTAPMVERYLIKKSLMKPLQDYQAYKRMKTLESKGQDASIASSQGLEQFLVSQGFLPPPAKNGPASATPGASGAMTPSSR